jgi:hypothetical protein
LLPIHQRRFHVLDGRSLARDIALGVIQGKIGRAEIVVSAVLTVNSYSALVSGVSRFVSVPLRVRLPNGLPRTLGGKLANALDCR